ncbi:DctP family TRAP transporter solute-binding subunit [Paenibacillus farraposensis]|uniref:DctP family TRAP transporter solute-binding subunit n=1 Tax=Paenibacillus farraposensis TaxID=2807095 RepID=A0ABW4D955_9BACL|nr:DctP family TRAP transporter solute-binding subunit [Paenibacillus farraposensis]MCC3382169.1 DctP family TRAP transporter solute-binding subunit [Paenibacillus farraposensis]
MKRAVGFAVLLILGILTAYVIGIQKDFGEELPYDDEFTGLKDRIVIKFSHVVAENSPKGLAAARFAQLVKEKSKDRIEIQVFPNGIRYSETTEVAALQRGEIQMIAPSFSNLNAIDPAWLVMDLPFAFENQAEVDQALNGPLGKRLSQTLEPYGMKGIAFWSNGFRQITNNTRPIRQPADFKGLKFRIQPSQVLERQFEALGASTISTPFNEIYHNLETGTADGQENTISNILTKRFYQVQRYMTVSNHSYLGYAVIFNKSYWDSLPSDAKLVLQEALEETTRWNQRETDENANWLSQLQQNGNITITRLSEGERARWKEHLRVLYSEFTPLIGSDLMSMIQGP